MRVVVVVQIAAIAIVLWLCLMGLSLNGWRPGRNSIEERLHRLDSTQLRHVIAVSENLLQERDDHNNADTAPLTEKVNKKQHRRRDTSEDEDEELIQPSKVSRNKDRIHKRERQTIHEGDTDTDEEVKRRPTPNHHKRSRASDDDEHLESAEGEEDEKPKHTPKNHHKTRGSSNEQEAATENEEEKPRHKHKNHHKKIHDSSDQEEAAMNSDEGEKPRHKPSKKQHKAEDDHPEPAKKKRKRTSNDDKDTKVIQDNAVKKNPGGTESEALEERRLLSKLNWPLEDYTDAVWHDTDKPVVPDKLLKLQTTYKSSKKLYTKAMAQCALDSSESSSNAKKHANVNTNCFQKAYWDHLVSRTSAQDRKMQCDEIYSYPSIELFKSKKNTRMMCERTAEDGSDISCHTRRLRGHSSDTPFCEASNVGVIFDKMPHAQQFPWLDFKKGAFESHGCDVSEKIKSQWKGMFIQCVADWFNKGFTATNTPSECDVTITKPTYFVTRAGDYSPFHIAHDFLNLFMSSSILGFDFQDLQIVIHDRMTKGFYLPLWQWVYSSGNKLLWYPDLKEEYRGKTVCYEKAYFNVPARLSLLYNDHSDCIVQESSTMRAFSDFVLGAYDAVGVGSIRPKIVVTLIARRNYKTGHSIGRRFGNEDELLTLLSSFDDVIVNPVDYASFDFDSQLNISRSTDFLVAMHGAGLIQMMFLPTWGGVFEFFCPEKPPSNFRYRHLAGYMGLAYKSFTLHSAENVVPIDDVRADLSIQIKEVRQRKQAALDEENDGDVDNTFI